METFRVELKKVVDDSYEIEIGFELEDQLIQDIRNGLVGTIHKFAVITDSTVEPLYGRSIYQGIRQICLCSRPERPARPGKQRKR